MVGLISHASFMFDNKYIAIGFNLTTKTALILFSMGKVKALGSTVPLGIRKTNNSVLFSDLSFVKVNKNIVEHRYIRIKRNNEMKTLLCINDVEVKMREKRKMIDLMYYKASVKLRVKNKIFWLFIPCIHFWKLSTYIFNTSMYAFLNPDACEYEATEKTSFVNSQSILKIDVLDVLAEILINYCIQVWAPSKHVKKLISLSHSNMYKTLYSYIQLP